MLAKKYRLKKKSDIQLLFSKGKSVANPYLVIYALPREGAGQARIAFAVSKKLGNAVVRNRIKRLLREGVRAQIGAIDSRYDIIFVARAKIKGISLADVETNITNLLKRAKLFQQKES